MSDRERDPRSEPEETAPRLEEPVAGDEELGIDGPLRRNRWLLAVIGVLLIGIPLTRILDTYRGIILEVRGGEMLVAFERTSPEWLAAIEAAPGTVVEKRTGAWQPVPVRQAPEDEPLLVFWRRYSDAYEGRIIQISPPQNDGDPQPVVIQTTDGRKVEWTDMQADTKVGQRVVKKAGTWDPVVDQAQRR
jgi:hypothetical protein